MSNNIKKAVDFNNARVKADDIQARAESDIIKQYLSTRLENFKKGDLVQIPLPKNKLMKLEVIDDGLYQGWVQDSMNNDILYHIDKATMSQLVENVVNRDPGLQIKQNGNDKESSKVINLTINIGKSIEEFIDMNKGRRFPPKDFVGRMKPEKPKKKKEDNEKEKSLKSKENNMNKEQLKKAIKNVLIKSKEDKSARLWEINENEELNKSVDGLLNGTTEIPSWNDEPLTDQAKIVNDNIQKSIKN